MRIKDLVLVTSLLLLSIGPVTAQNRPERVADDFKGFSFARPAGWEHKFNSEGFYFTDSGKTVILAVRPHAHADFNSFWAESNTQNELPPPLKEIKGGKHFRTVNRGIQTMVIDTLVLFSPFGGGVTIVGLSVERTADASLKTAMAIANSVQFASPQVSPTAAKVKNELSGKLLTYQYTGNGYSERIDIALCPSGTAYRSAERRAIPPKDLPSPGLAAFRQKAGKWRIAPDGGMLIVKMTSGEDFEYRLTSNTSANEIGFNGFRFLVKPQTICR